MFSLSKASTLAKRALMSHKLMAQNTDALIQSNNQHQFNNIFNQVQMRTSTKKAAGSKTNMKNSAGRRLGPKRNEGQLVKTGEIIYRQRGTTIYPGENCDIGKDHTIYAKEPGFVRYYLDPFHPKRKFVGIALRQDLRLPTDHWAPRVRRFGYVELVNKDEAAKEELHLSRKEWLLKQKLEDEIKQREEKRIARKEVLSKQFSELNSASEKKLSIDNEQEQGTLRVVGNRLALVERYLKNGFSTTEAQQNATFNDLYDYKLALKRSEIDQAKHDALVSQYQTIAAHLDNAVDFDWQYNLVKKLTVEEKQAKKNAVYQQLKELTKRENLPLKPEQKRQISELIGSNAAVLTKSEAVHFRRQFLKPVLPEAVAVADKPSKKTVSYKKFDYENGKVINVHRTKEAFLSKVK